MNSILSLSLPFFFFLLFSPASSFNITQVLGEYSQFSTFNSYLTQTQLAGEINSRRTITVLAVENDNMSPLSGQPNDLLRSIMSVHVVLDYYDVKKLQNLPNKTANLVTLFQASGKASGDQGRINVTDLSTGTVVLGSAVKGATLGSSLVKSVAAQPYNISVLQISNVIIPTDIANSTANSTSPSVPPPAASGPNKPATPPPTRSPMVPPPRSGSAPAPSKAKAPAPSKAPSSAPTPTADALGSSPPKPDEPAADTPGAEPPSDNSGTVLGLGLLNVVTTIASSILWLVSII